MWNHLEWYTANLSYFNTYSKLAERAQHYLKFRFKINIILDITQNKFCSSFFWHIDFNLNWNQCWCSETVFSLYICSVENLNSSAKEASQLLNVQWKKKKSWDNLWNFLHVAVIIQAGILLRHDKSSLISIFNLLFYSTSLHYYLIWSPNHL